MKVPFEEYSTKYDAFLKMRREDGILEVRLETNGGSSVLSGDLHQALGHCFLDIGSDVDNRVIILTGTGETFIEMADMSVYEGYTATPAEYVPLIAESWRLLNNFVEIEVPVIAAVNGPAPIHAEIPALADIVIASDTAYFADVFHFINDVVPGDGTHIVWPLLLGLGRARYFIMTGQKIWADEAKQLGFVHEVLPHDQVNHRAWEVARDLLQYSDVTLRSTRLLFAQQIRKHLVEQLPVGLALEGLGFCRYFPSKMKPF